MVFHIWAFGKRQKWEATHVRENSMTCSSQKKKKKKLNDFSVCLKSKKYSGGWKRGLRKNDF